jgi:hypothetical protein
MNWLTRCFAVPVLVLAAQRYTVGVALIAAMYFRGNVKFAAVIPVIALSRLNRLLRRVVQRQ